MAGTTGVLDEAMIAFINQHQVAIMVTVRKDGTPHTARCNAGVVDGKLWSPGRPYTVRTRHLEAGSRVALTILEQGDGGAWLGLEGTARVLYENGPALYVKFFKATRTSDEDDDALLRRAIKEDRLIYEFDVERAYGRYITRPPKVFGQD